MATAASVVLRRIRRLIADEAVDAVAGHRWSDTELLAWLSEAQRQVVALKPEANIITDLMSPVAGESRQMIATANLSGGIEPYRLIRVEANDGTEPPSLEVTWWSRDSNADAAPTYTWQFWHTVDADFDDLENITISQEDVAFQLTAPVRKTASTTEWTYAIGLKYILRISRDGLTQQVVEFT